MLIFKPCRTIFRRTSACVAPDAPESRGAAFRDWVGAGTMSGMSLGALYGFVIGSLSGPPPFVVGAILIGGAVGILFGAVVGTVSGLVIGVVNGLVSLLLSSADLLGRSKASRRLRAGLAAGASSGIVAFTLLDLSIGQAGWLFAGLPAVLAALVGVVLSQMIEVEPASAPLKCRWPMRK